MELLPHPHIGLQTVTWPIRGEIRHRDSRGSDVVIRPGQLDLMTSGDGIAHSEFTAGEGSADLESLQLWVALPTPAATGENGFEQHTELPEWSDGMLAATVILGELGGVRSPATVHTPIVGAAVRVEAGVTGALPLDARWEHALLITEGSLEVDGRTLVAGPLLYLGLGRESLPLANRGAHPVTAYLLGGEPFGEDLVMWWNFVGRSHEQIVAARADWEAGSPRFARIADHGDARIPAPVLPGIRLTPRRRRPPLSAE